MIVDSQIETFIFTMSVIIQANEVNENGVVIFLAINPVDKMQK